VIATGNLFYFGQFGQSVQGYPVSLINGPIWYPITAEFIFGDMNLVNDTCQLTYAGPVSSIGEMDSNSAHAFYNSSLKEIQITSNNINGTPYSLYNSTGQLVKSGTCSSTISRIGLEGYSTGIYILQMGKEKRFRFLVNWSRSDWTKRLITKWLKSAYQPIFFVYSRPFLGSDKTLSHWTITNSFIPHACEGEWNTN
jgi:hypothetical protein